jgi:hypothetical protein
MMDHAVMRMEDLKPEDFDDIDESDIIEVNEARPVRGDQVTVKLLIPLTHDDFVALSAIEKRTGRSIIDLAQEAVHAYIVERSEQQQPAPPRRAAG